MITYSASLQLDVASSARIFQSRVLTVSNQLVDSGRRMSCMAGARCFSRSVVEQNNSTTL
jgi:hypothetical protein